MIIIDPISNSPMLLEGVSRAAEQTGPEILSAHTSVTGDEPDNQVHIDELVDPIQNVSLGDEELNSIHIGDGSAVAGNSFDPLGTNDASPLLNLDEGNSNDMTLPDQEYPIPFVDLDMSDVLPDLS